jgi:hypothetical protein
MKHIKMSHRCLHRRFCRAAAIESNESRWLCARLHWSIWVARPSNSWPNPKLKLFTLSLVISIPFNRNRDERVVECSYVPSNNQQSWECGCLHRRFSRAAKIESNERSISTSVESKRSPIDRGETRRRSTQIDQCKRLFCFSRIEMLADWSRRNTVSVFSFGRAAKVMRSTNVNAS